MLRVRAGVPKEREEAFNVLVTKYRTPVVHFLYRMVDHPALAEELAQEVFLRVYRARRSYRPQARFSTWLFRIATNVGLNAMRDGRMRRVRETSMDTEAGEPALAAMLADPAANAEQTMLAAERREEIRRAVNSLPEKQRLAVLLHKY